MNHTRLKKITVKLVSYDIKLPGFTNSTYLNINNSSNNCSSCNQCAASGNCKGRSKIVKTKVGKQQ